ncbi:hypothetical protein [Candidatus Leptofilum sp.]|uniref:hypothetical protein n=1 Tax=Candidatus Leptofilum sp. TaxID=3241576 RepID=UPI003B5C6191
MDDRKRAIDATQATLHTLKKIAHTRKVHELSSLSLPEIDKLVAAIAKYAPAGNVPSVILNGLLRLPHRKPPASTVRRDIHLLFKGVDQALLDKAVYGTFFAGPAAVLWAYQNLLKLAGKEVDASFPEGIWQFYVDYALRDDTARHACETHGFDTALRQHNIQLSPVDRVTALAMTAVYTLHQYYGLLENEWRERVFTTALQEVTADLPNHAQFAELYHRWEQRRPYGRAADVQPQEDYPAYRRRKFDTFLADALNELPSEAKTAWQQKIAAAEAEALPAYQRQMSIRAYLQPSLYGEERKPISIEQMQIGIIYQGRYYLLPACADKNGCPQDVGTMRSFISGLMHRAVDAAPAQLTELARTKRAAFPEIMKQIGEGLRQELTSLRLAPIWINADQQSRHQPLATLRQAERAIGDQPLTIFDTGETFVFDLSHIFFDGIWGAAMAEIMTNEALSWAVYLHDLPSVTGRSQRPYAPQLAPRASDQQKVRVAPRVAQEVSAETNAINLEAILQLRELFKQRNDLLRMTVNDLLVLYRTIHGLAYRPAPELVTQLEALLADGRTQAAAKTALKAIQTQGSNPVSLIPVDASRRNPRDRVYPMTFEVPLANLDLIGEHQRVLAALRNYERATRNRQHIYGQFEKLQKSYLTMLAGFGEVLNQAKIRASTGESMSVDTIRLLAHLPVSVQRLLDKIPGQFDVLNDLIKGREVFSNVGRVAPGSSLTRFMTAKDDNEKKELAWGVLTDADGVIHVTVRDFRPHVAQLTAVGRHDLAIRIIADQLDSFATGLNNYVRDLHRIVTTSYEKRGIFSR